MGSLTCFQTFSQPLPCLSILPRGRSVLQVLDTTPLYTLLWAAQPYKMGTTWYTKLDHIFFGVCGCLSVYLVIYEPSSCKRNIQWVSHSFKLPVPLSEHYTLCTSCLYCNHVPPSRKGVMYFIDPVHTQSMTSSITFATCLQPFWDLWGAFFWNLSGIMMVIS